MAQIDAFGLTDVGRKRKHNEDAYALDETEGLFIVADGMGGHAAGEVAAKITVETIGEFIAATRQKEEATWPFKYNHELHFNSNRLAIAIEKANERVMSAVAAQPWLKGMGTTVVAGLLNEKILSLAHVGDSRAYLYRAGELTRLTDDHSWVHEQVSAGILTEEEAKTHPLKNVVTRALGGGPSVAPDLREMEFSRGDAFLFCSDGLTTMLSDEEIRDSIAVDETQDAGGPLPGPRRSRQREGRRRQHHRGLRPHPRPGDAREGRPRAEGRQGGRAGEGREVGATPAPGVRTTVDDPLPGGYPQECVDRARPACSSPASSWRMRGRAGRFSALRPTRTGASSNRPSARSWATPALRDDAATSSSGRSPRLPCIDFRAHPRALGRLWVQEVVLRSRRGSLWRRAREEAASSGEKAAASPGAARHGRARNDGRLSCARPPASSRARTEASPSRLQSRRSRSRGPRRGPARSDHRAPPVVRARKERPTRFGSPGRRTAPTARPSFGTRTPPFRPTSSSSPRETGARSRSRAWRASTSSSRAATRAWPGCKAPVDCVRERPRRSRGSRPARRRAPSARA